MKHLGLSGAGFAIPGIAGAAYQILKDGYKPDIISGVSSGAILSFIFTFADKPLELIEKEITNFSSSDVFDTPPLTKKGKLSFKGIFNLIFKGYFSSKNNLEKTLIRLVPEDTFYCKQNNFNTPISLVLCVDLLSGSRVIKKLNDLTYLEAISAVVASASIPIFTKPVKTDKNVLVDGGLRHHILTTHVFRNFPIEENWNIFSRPQDFKKPIEEKQLKNSLQVLTRTIEIMQFEISKSDELLSDLLASTKGINHNNIFVDRILNNVYQEDKKLAQELFENGKEKVLNFSKIPQL
jgi:predicted acylesterase/phospholipase RssA